MESCVRCEHEGFAVLWPSEELLDWLGHSLSSVARCLGEKCYIEMAGSREGGAGGRVHSC